MLFCDQILMKHPSWVEKQQNVMKRLTLDYSCTSDWDPDKQLVSDIDFTSVWNSGRAFAETELNRTKHKGQKCDFAQLASEGKTLLKPLNGKTKIGLHEVEIDLSMDFDETVTDDVEVRVVNDSFIDVIDQANTHETQIEIDSTFVYKASVLGSLFSGDRISKDRLRRVQGMTRTNKGFGSDDLSIDTMIMVGDPILVTTERGELQIAMIMGMCQAGKKEKRIPVERLSDKNVQLDVKIMFMDLQEGNNWYVWNGECIGSQFKSDGSKVFPICPELREVNGEFMYSFDRQVILDMGVGMNVSSQGEGATVSRNTTSSKKDKLKLCIICKKEIDLLKMRTHIGMHITKEDFLNETLVDVCGFCGGIACSNRLEVSSSQGGDDFYKYVSNCQYKVDTKRKSKFSVRCKCTNHLQKCNICKCDFWTYAGHMHYELMHPNFEVPSFVTEEERKAVKGLKN